MGKRLSESDREALLAELKSVYEDGGLTIKEMCILYDVSYSTMHFRLLAAGTKMRPRNDQPPIGEPVVNPLSLHCSKCGADRYKRCYNTYGMTINDFHVARKRAAAAGVDRPCEM